MSGALPALTKRPHEIMIAGAVSEMIGLGVCHALASVVERRRLLIVFFIATALAAVLVPATHSSEPYGNLFLRRRPSNAFNRSFSRRVLCSRGQTNSVVVPTPHRCLHHGNVSDSTSLDRRRLIRMYRTSRCHDGPATFGYSIFSVVSTAVHRLCHGGMSRGIRCLSITLDTCAMQIARNDSRS